MPEQLLHGSNVITVLEQVRRKCVPEGVRSDALRDTGPTHSIRDLPLDRRLVQMKARGWTPLRITTDPRGGKHKLPGPVRAGVGRMRMMCRT